MILSGLVCFGWIFNIFSQQFLDVSTEFFNFFYHCLSVFIEID